MMGADPIVQVGGQSLDAWDTDPQLVEGVVTARLGPGGVPMGVTVGASGPGQVNAAAAHAPQRGEPPNTPLVTNRPAVGAERAAEVGIPAPPGMGLPADGSGAGGWAPWRRKRRALPPARRDR
jgi:hypothetical protein